MEIAAVFCVRIGGREDFVVGGNDFVLKPYQASEIFDCMAPHVIPP